MITPSTLGTYPVERELGRGGMGVVYLARDPRLNRQVAIKVLPDLLTLNPDSLARFDREAKLLASLNHPNIAAIYGIEIVEASRQQLLVLEYVPGDTLAARVSRGALPIDEALDVCRQIALAIEAAHEGGVIHRDLKPGNVKVTPDGQVKVLDFGLAKGGSASASSADLAQSPTLTYSPTGIGVILGTAGYMSPEQARGKVVDKRTDIWSFGCVLYECLTGREPFGGETVSDAIAKILEREPDWTALPANTPPRIRELLRRCLERDVKKRQRDIGDVRIELDEAIAARASASRSSSVSLPQDPTTSRAPRSRTLAIALACILIGAAAGMGLWSVFGSGGRGGLTSARPVRLSVGIPPSIHATYAGFTRDGRNLIVFGFPRKPDGTEDVLGRMYTRPIGDYELKLIPGTEGATDFVRSPDGVWLAIIARVSAQSAQRRILKLRTDGSAPPVVLADWDDAWQGVVWLEDNDLLIMTDIGTKFFRLPTGGGPAKPAVKLDLGGFSGYPSFDRPLPGDRGVFLSMDAWGARGYQQDEWLLDPKTGKAHRFLESASNPTWVPSGHVVFARGEALMAVPFDLDRLVATGDVTAIENGLRTQSSWSNGTFEVTGDGSVIYPPGGRLGADRQLVTVDSAGAVKAFTSERRPYEYGVVASRDGRKVASVLSNSKGTFEIWVADLDRPGLKRMVALPNADCAGPVWSPDGRRMAYARTARDKDDGIYVQNADGSGSPQLVLTQDSQEMFLSPTSWAPDGSGLLVDKKAGGKVHILFVPVPASGGPGTPSNARVTAASESGARVSPDGRLVAFTSDESGRDEVYVSTFGAGGVFGPPVMISSAGGSGAAWTGDSRRLFYYNAPGKLMSVAIEPRSGVSASTPVIVQDFRKLRLDSNGWDILPDGRVLALQQGEGEDEIREFHVILNWFEELKAKMGKR